MKALVLTRILVRYPELIEKIDQSNIMKIAVNHAPCKSDYRVFNDYDKWTEYNCDQYTKTGEKLITVLAGLKVLPRHIWMYFKPVSKPSLEFNNSLIINHKKGEHGELFYYGGSIITGVDLAIRLGATEVLIIADNTVYYERFQENIKKSIEKLKAHCSLYCFKAENNFDLPFINLAKFVL